MGLILYPQQNALQHQQLYLYVEQQNKQRQLEHCL